MNFIAFYRARRVPSTRYPDGSHTKASLSRHSRRTAAFSPPPAVLRRGHASRSALPAFNGISRSSKGGSHEAH